MPVTILDAGIDIPRLPNHEQKSKQAQLSVDISSLMPTFDLTASAATEEFYNTCHAPQDGKFCETVGTLEKASPREFSASKKLAKAKVAAAPVPTREQVLTQRKKAALAAKQGKRPGGESRGNSADRRARAERLFEEWGGTKKGYIVCPVSGMKLHYTDDPTLNPKQYPKFTQDKIFTNAQGGGYRFENLLPVLASANAARNDRPLRDENLDALRASIEEFYNTCHDPETGQFCGGSDLPDESYIRIEQHPTAKYAERSAEWQETLSDEEKSALSNWTWDKYATVNRLARSNPDDQLIKDIDSAIAKAPPLDTPIRVYRGVQLSSFAERDGILNNTNVGDEISLALNGYQATSVSQRHPVARTGSWDIMYEIIAKSGAPIHSLGPMGENELLIGRDKKFTVKAKRTIKYRSASGRIETRETIQVEEI